MFPHYSTRRDFLKYGKLSFLLFLNSCSNFSKKNRIALQSSFYPDSFKNTIPSDWQKENINFQITQPEKIRNIILDSDFTLINDGWINKINLNEYKRINEDNLFDMLDKRSRDFINSFEENQKNKLFPIGVVPYAIIIKNNKSIAIFKGSSIKWD